LLGIGKGLVAALLVLHFIRTSPPIATKTKHAPVIPLYSQLDYWGIFHTIEFGNVSAFNPSLLTLPSRNAFVVVAREEYQFQWIDGIMVQPRHVVAGLLHVESDSERRWAPKESPIIRSHSVERLQLVHSNATYFPHCDLETNAIQGPEDPRLIWSHLGEPLMIYNSVAKEANLCRQFYLVDLRSVYVMDISDTKPPIRFNESIPISYGGQEGVHKNWAPFTNSAGDVFFHIHLIPQTIYKLSQGVLEWVIGHPPEDENCITIALEGMPKQRVHQSTPFLDVVLCRSTDVRCDRDPNNHVYMGVIHAQHIISNTRYYETRVVTLNYSLPFNYISISKPMLYCMILHFC